MIARYAAQRFVQMIPTVLLISALVFGLILIIPGDPVMAMLGYVTEDRSRVSPEVYARMRERLGLDDPIHVQYLRWLGRALQGDLGTSVVSGQPVTNIILGRLPATLYLAIASMLLAIAIAIPGGLWAAVRQNTPVDHTASAFVLFGICTPGFWIALLLVLVFSIWLGWLPSLGYTPPQENFGKFLTQLAMPMVVLGTEVGAQILRFVRTEFLEQLHQDYVRTARAKGLPRRVVLWKHTLKNSLIAATTVMGFQVAHLLGGSTIIETVFAWPGISYLLVQSIFARDFVVVQAVVLVIAMIVLIVNFMVDVLYRALDPRIRLE
jgi:peptide/nickel transport system permease protein